MLLRLLQLSRVDWLLDLLIVGLRILDRMSATAHLLDPSDEGPSSPLIRPCKWRVAWQNAMPLSFSLRLHQLTLQALESEDARALVIGADAAPHLRAGTLHPQCQDVELELPQLAVALALYVLDQRRRASHCPTCHGIRRSVSRGWPFTVCR